MQPSYQEFTPEPSKSLRRTILPTPEPDSPVTTKCVYCNDTFTHRFAITVCINCDKQLFCQNYVEKYGLSVNDLDLFDPKQVAKMAVETDTFLAGSRKDKVQF